MTEIMWKRRLAGMLTLAALSLGAPALAETSEEELQKQIKALQEGQQAIQREMELEKQIESLRQGQEAIQKELAEIKRLIAARPAAAAAAPSGPAVEGKVFDLGANPVKGDPAAKLTLIEFTDYQCPFCSRHTSNTAPEIVKEYVDTGKVRWALMDLPLESIHKLAFKAAEATHCAEEQGKFWEMHDRLFENQKSLEPWSAHAEALGIDVTAFESCLESGKYGESVRKDMAEAQKAGARGTPSFVLAKTNPDDPSKVTGITFLRGAQGFNAFKAAFDSALEEPGD